MAEAVETSTVAPDAPTSDTKVEQAADAPISADEIALYDRQIRLWGVQAQEKIRNAHVLLITVKALGNEIAKNLVLAGIGSLTLIDSAIVTEDDLGAQFFITEEDIGKSRAEAAVPSIKKLNPRVTVSVHPRSLEEILTAGNPQLLSQFTIIIGADLSYPYLTLLNAASRLAGKPFYAGGSHGLYGYVFADLISHTFAIQRAKSNVPVLPGTKETPTRIVVSTQESRDDAGKPIELVTKHESYQPLILANSSSLPDAILSNRRRLKSVSPLLPCLRALWDFESNTTPPRGPSHNATDITYFTKLATEKSRELQLPQELLRSEFLRGFLQNLYAELAPTCGFLGGILAQDVINVLGGKEQPLQNLLLFEGEEGRGETYALVPSVTTNDVQTIAAEQAQL